MKPPYDTFPVGTINFDTLPSYRVNVVEKNLAAAAAAGYSCDRRNIRGRLVVLDNPIGHFDIVEPEGGCGTTLKLPSTTGGKFKSSYEQFKYLYERYPDKFSYMNNISNWIEQISVYNSVKNDGCSLITNAGFFNTTDFACFGDLVREGQVIQVSATHNVNFGIRKGLFVTGYVDPEEVEEGEPFDSLVSGK
jgi:hypothetical protein